LVKLNPNSDTANEYFKSGTNKKLKPKKLCDWSLCGKLKYKKSNEIIAVIPHVTLRHDFHQ
jgi:hypothetical protein